MTAIYNSGRLPWGQRYCQVLASMARNPALSDPKLLQMLPSSIAALEVIATLLDAKLIQEGLRSRALHRGLTRQAAQAAAHQLRRQALLKSSWRGSALGYCLVIVLAGTFTQVVQRYLDWNEQSKGVKVLKYGCGVLVLLGGVYLIYTAH